MSGRSMPTPSAASAATMASAAAASAAPLPAVGVDLRAMVGVPTGIGVYTRSLLLELARQHAFRLTGLAHREAVGAAELQAAGIAVEHQPAPLGVLWQQLLLPRRLARGDIDLLWSPLITLPLICPVPAVVTVHDLTVLLYPEAHRLKVRWSQIPFLRSSLETARRLVAISHATAADIAFHFPQCADKVRVIHNGIDTDFVPGKPAEIAATRSEFGAERQGYLLYAATLEPRKGVAVLLDAWEALREEDPETPPLVLAGPYGWGSQALLRRLERLRGRGVFLLGRVERPQLVRLFQAARLFVYPSLYEGFGLPPAEALACGVPAVVCRSSSLPEVVGDAGVLVEPGDAADLAMAIRRLLGDPALEAELRARAPLQAARFRWDDAGRALAAVFREALE
jgi:glycosyltransferase involved in cell wall biosynthesis